MVQIYCGINTFCATLENVLQGSIFKLPGRKYNILDKKIRRPLHRLPRSGRWTKTSMEYLFNRVEQAICYCKAKAKSKNALNQIINQVFKVA